MQRLNYTPASVAAQRSEVREAYDQYSTPLPGTALKVDDDIMWMDVLPMRVLWGYESPDYFAGYNPEIFGESYAFLEGQYITDRAPADSNETPMPIYPQQQQQRQHGKKHDPKAALHHLLKQLDHEHAQKVRALVKQKRPELLEGDKP